MNETKLPPPVDQQGDNTSVHLSYLRRDVDNVSLKQDKLDSKLDRLDEKISSKLDILSGVYVSTVDFQEHLKSAKDHEDRIRILEDSRMKVVVLTGSITGFLSIIGSYLLSLLR